MSFILRKGPSGPPYEDSYTAGGTLRAEADGSIESVIGANPGELWYWNGSMWLPTSTAPEDGQGPVWDAAANDYRFDTVGASALRYFDTTHSPIGLWNFDDTLADTSGNGNNLTLAAGNGGFADVVPGKRGLFVWVGARYATAAAVPLFQLTGDFTAQAIVQQDTNPITTDQTIVTYNGPGETQPDNTLYQFNLQATGAFNNTRNLSFVSESGAGVNATYSSSGTTASLGCIHNILKVDMRRQSNVIQFFVNGRPFGNPSAALTTPNGGNGANTRLVVGTNGPTGTAADQILIFGLKLVSQALTNAELLAEYNRTMGPAFGTIS